MSDSPIRSIAKTISWRLVGSGATFIIGWSIAGNVAIAGTIATFQLIVNTALYYIHERIWNKISWMNK